MITGMKNPFRKAYWGKENTGNIFRKSFWQTRKLEKSVAAKREFYQGILDTRKEEQGQPKQDEKTLETLVDRLREYRKRRPKSAIMFGSMAAGLFAIMKYLYLPSLVEIIRNIQGDTAKTVATIAGGLAYGVGNIMAALTGAAALFLATFPLLEKHSKKSMAKIIAKASKIESIDEAERAYLRFSRRLQLWWSLTILGVAGTLYATLLSLNATWLFLNPSGNAATFLQAAIASAYATVFGLFRIGANGSHKNATMERAKDIYDGLNPDEQNRITGEMHENQNPDSSVARGPG